MLSMPDDPDLGGLEARIKDLVASARVLSGIRVITYQEMARPPIAATPVVAFPHSQEAKRCPVFLHGGTPGYLVFPPFDASVRWLGGKEFEVQIGDELQCRIWPKVMEELIGCATDWWCSKIDGVFQIDAGHIFATSVGTKLLLTHPFNRPNESCWTHTGLLDSDWFWVPSTVNVQFWRVGELARLRRDEPIAQILSIAGSEGGEQKHGIERVRISPNYIKLWRSYINRTHGNIGDASARKRKGVYGQLKRIFDGK